MTTDQIVSWAQEHVGWIVGGAITWVVSVSAGIAVATFQNAAQQATLDQRAPAVEELARVGARLSASVESSSQFRQDVTARLDRIENKLDRALEK